MARPLAATFDGSSALPPEAREPEPQAPAPVSSARAIALTAMGFFGVLLLAGVAFFLLR